MDNQWMMKMIDKLFAHERRDRMKGIVLVDTVHEERYETEEPHRIKALQKSLRWMILGMIAPIRGCPVF